MVQAKLGTTVEFEDVTDKRSERFALVAPEHASPCYGKLSVASPVGQGLLGLSAGETVDVQTPTGVHRLRVESVTEWSADDRLPAPRPPAHVSAAARKPRRGRR